MKKVWVKSIKLVNLSDNKKGEIELTSGINIIRSKKNGQGKTTLSNAISFVLGLSFNPFENLLDQKNWTLNEKIMTILVVVTFVIDDQRGSKEFTLCRISTKDASIDTKNRYIYCFTEGKFVKKYKIGAWGKNNIEDNLSMLAKDVYEELDIPYLKILCKDKKANALELTAPYINSILGFFSIRQDNQNNEFIFYKSDEVSIYNNFNIDGRLITFMTMSGFLSEKETNELVLEPIKNQTELQSLKNERENILFSIEKLKSKKENLRDFAKNSKELEIKLKDIDDIQEKLKFNLLTKIKFKKKESFISNKVKEIENEKSYLHEFMKKNQDREIRFYDESNILKKAQFNDVFNSIYNKVVYEENLNDLKEQLKVLKNKRLDLQKTIEKQEKLISEKKNFIKDEIEKNNVSDKDNMIGNIRELILELEREIDQIDSKINLINEKQKENKLNEKNIFNSNLYEKYEENQIEKIYKEVIYKFSKQITKDDKEIPLLKMNPYISITDFPINMKSSKYINTGSSENPYALTKMYFYIKNIEIFKPFYWVDYGPSADMGKDLEEYNNTLLKEIINLASVKKTQFFIFANNFPDELLSNTHEQNIIIMENDVNKLLAKPLNNNDLLLINSIMN